MVGTVDGKSDANGIGFGEGATVVRSTSRKLDALIVGAFFEPLDGADFADCGDGATVESGTFRKVDETLLGTSLDLLDGADFDDREIGNIFPEKKS